MKIVIISGGNIHSDFALSFLEDYKPDYIIGVDGGLNFCKEHQIMPNYMLGDFDSIKKEVLEYFKANAIPMDTYQTKKDDTDTELAVKKACELKATQIYILGGTGTRLDHVIGNLQVLYRTIESGIPCYLLDATNKITILLPGNTYLQKEQQHGVYVSFLPFTDEVVGLTLKGFAYPLLDHTMTKRNSLGVSNEFSRELACVSFKKGALLMIQSKD